MSRRAVLVSIVGRVQGVGFRDWLMHQATIRKLDGWVRNRADGSVEALFSGEDADIDAMIAQCHAGPAYARVLEVRQQAYDGAVEPGFVRRPTA